VAAELEMAPERQAWLVESLSRDAGDGRAVMCSSSWTRPDMVRMVVEMS
jgi:hypothetical protein